MKCIAVDDEQKALNILQMFIEKVHFLELEGLFRSPLDALGFLQETAIGKICTGRISDRTPDCGIFDIKSGYFPCMHGQREGKVSHSTE